MVLPSYYLPPVSWFVRMLNANEPILVEQWANYRKQTLHNRCWIDSPNGRLALTVPVDRSTFVGGKCLMKDVQVSDHTDWQRQHWYALESSYYNSPFFEYLQDDFRPVYEKKWKWLMDMNEELVEKCLEIVKPLSPALSPEGAREVDREGRGVYRMERTREWSGEDQRINASTNQPLNASTHQPINASTYQTYYQVFSHKHGFLENLSIVDLIFNMGPESVLYLTKKTH